MSRASLYWPRAHQARAEEHIADVRQAISDYVDDLQGASGGTVRHWQPRVTLRTREAVDSLRWALDTLVVELARLDSGREHGPYDVRFPVETDRETFDGRADTLLRGVSSKHREALARFQPFNDVLWPYYLLVMSQPDTAIDAITGVSSVSGLPEGTDIRRVGTATYTFTVFYGDLQDEEHEEIPLEDALPLAVDGVAEVIATFEPEFEG